MLSLDAFVPSSAQFSAVHFSVNGINEKRGRVMNEANRDKRENSNSRKEFWRREFP